ncbi:MAG: hypothetical protein RIS64_2815, partial [Bacteroidota bacterium]
YELGFSQIHIGCVYWKLQTHRYIGDIGHKLLKHKLLKINFLGI